MTNEAQESDAVKLTRINDAITQDNNQKAADLVEAQKGPISEQNLANRSRDSEPTSEDFKWAQKVQAAKEAQEQQNGRG